MSCKPYLQEIEFNFSSPIFSRCWMAYWRPPWIRLSFYLVDAIHKFCSPLFCVVSLSFTHTHVKGNNRQSIDLWPSRKEMDVNLLLQQHQLFFQLLWYGGRFNHPAVRAQPRAVVVLWPQLYSSPRCSGCNWKLSFCIYSVPMPKKSTNLPTSFNYTDVLF